MRTENFYTEMNGNGEFMMIYVDIFAKTYKVECGLSETDVENHYADFVAAEIFDALTLGLKSKGYKEI